ncbi:MAG: endonuclease domain-containing protein [Pseudomonadota bacterium]
MSELRAKRPAAALGSVRAFRFTSFDYEEASATARLRYAFDDRYAFEETFTFEGAPTRLDPTRRAALAVALRHLHLAAGVSYYKAFAPPRLVVDGPPLDPSSARFFTDFYLNGLGEFAYLNGLDLEGRIEFPSDPRAASAPASLALARRTAVPVGGGKDSILTIEALKAAGEPIVLIAIGRPRPIAEVMAVAGVPAIAVRRQLSPLILDLNARGALNGHVPITGILAFVLAAAAVLYGFDTVAMSNERSANVGNLTRDGFKINHQYSKSLAFERALSAHFHARVLPTFTYFSFLRPLSELGIAKRFAGLPAYHGVFSSCNGAFKLGGGAWSRWCRDCAKCRFVFLALAPFLDKARLLDIFGGDLLDADDQETGFRELMGLSGHKPFECVGETQESAAAMGALIGRPEWRGDRLVKRLGAELRPHLGDLARHMDRALAPSGEHLVPPRFAEMLDAFAGPREQARGDLGVRSRG